MALNNKHAEEISEGDLQSLIDNGVAEGVTIDYKEAPYGGSDVDRKEFLFDVSSFSNAAGGTLVIGMKEDHGIPVDLCGISNLEPDSLALSYENRLRDCIKPRIPGVTMAAISLRNGASAFVIQIPKSFAQPHMVEFKGHTWFYSRNSAGKYRLDVDQLRAVFIQSESLAQRIRSFRASRIASILGNEGPVPLPDLPKVVLHGIPLNSIEPGSTHDVSRFEEKASLLALGQGDNLPVSYRFNLDGYLVIHPFKNDPQHAFAYVQAFRDGSVEVCITGLMCEEDGDTPLRAKSVEREVAKVVNQMLTFQFEIGAEAPMVVMMLFLACRDIAFPVLIVIPGKLTRSLIGLI